MSEILGAGVVFAGGLVVGGAWALHAVGYGVRGGLAQIIRLRTYRLGNCKCGLCEPRR